MDYGPPLTLASIAHGRSGDKGDHANVAVVAYTEAGYRWLRDHLTAEKVADYFRPLGASAVERYEAANLFALNFVLRNALAGGASRSLRSDTQGKTLALALLQMPIDRPPDLAAMRRPKESVMSSDLVKYEIKGPAAVLTLNRADRRNSLNKELILALTAAVKRATADPQARAIVLTGDGPVFCAGMDLKELTGKTAEQPDPTAVWEDAMRLAVLFESIYTSPKPSVAALNGPAVAGGAGLMTVCDLAVAVPEARFGYPEVRRGLVAALVLPYLLALVGQRTARYLLLTGEVINAAEALRVGLVNEVVPADRLMPRAMELAYSVAEGGPNALASTKGLLKQFSNQAQPIQDLARASAAPRLTDECREGLQAFFNKRPVPWAPARPGGNAS